MAVPTKAEFDLRRRIDEVVRDMEQAFASCPPVDASSDDEVLQSASQVVNCIATDLRSAESLAKSLASLSGVTQEALMVVAAAHVAFELVRSALSLLRAELDARLAA